MRRRQHIRIIRCLVPLLAPLPSGHLYANPNWTLQPDCSLVSAEHAINDGYQNTPARLQLDGNRLTLLTDSNIDTGRPDTGLSVDGGERVAASGVENDTDLVFSHNLGSIIEQFIAGNSAEVHLHFWPTWPDTGQKTARFSLIGFTRAYRQKQNCH